MVQALTHILAVASSRQLWIGRLAWQVGGDRVDGSLQMQQPWLALEHRCRVTRVQHEAGVKAS